jgi:hypothetical protein
MATGKRYYVSVNFICDTDGSEKDEPSDEQLDVAFRTMLKEAQKPNVSIEFEVWDVVDQGEMG